MSVEQMPEKRFEVGWCYVVFLFRKQFKDTFFGVAILKLAPVEINHRCFRHVLLLLIYFFCFLHPIISHLFEYLGNLSNISAE